ncbi:MAG TPA: hypothetical protein VGO81_15575 [Solirubrobacteraceae bacterium]|nr:hypothetical protein [Solirubrobacteraceae bacterium]
MAALPAGALAAPQHHVQAHSAGGAATALIYPSIVSTRLVRAQAALDKAARYSDIGMPDKAIIALTAARNNLSKAWRGAKYVIRTTPPPPPADAKAVFHKRAFMKSGRLRIYTGRRSRRVHGADVVPPVGAVPATIYDTGFAALSLQHYAATVSVGLIDDTSGTTLTAVRSTLARSLNDRDAAIAYIHSIDIPPPPADAKVQAHHAGTPVGAGGWADTMPNATVQLDDEIQQVEGTLDNTGLTAAQTSILQGADYRDIKTERTLNQLWPPLPPAD